MVVFQYNWYDGIKDTYTQSIAQLRRDNDLCSLKVSPGCCAILFKKKNYGGESRRVCQDTDNLGVEWKNGVSSMVIEWKNKGNNNVIIVSHDVCFPEGYCFNVNLLG